MKWWLSREERNFRKEQKEKKRKKAEHDRILRIDRILRTNQEGQDHIQREDQHRNDLKAREVVVTKNAAQERKNEEAVRQQERSVWGKVEKLGCELRAAEAEKAPIQPHRPIQAERQSYD